MVCGTVRMRVFRRVRTLEPMSTPSVPSETPPTPRRLRLLRQAKVSPRGLCPLRRRARLQGPQVMAFTDEEILEEFVGACNRAPRREYYDPDEYRIFAPREPTCEQREYSRRCRAKLKQDPIRNEIRLLQMRAYRKAYRERVKADPVKAAEARAKENARDRAGRVRDNRRYYEKLKDDPVRLAAHRERTRRNARERLKRIYADPVQREAYRQYQRERAKLKKP